MAKLLLLSLLLYLVTSCNSSSTNQGTTTKRDTTKSPTDHLLLGEKVAREQLNDALKEKGQKFTYDLLIKNSATAIAIAEPILFNIYGKEQILKEKPYEVYFIGEYWYIAGTIPKGWDGGGFEIIFSAKDGRIIRLTHYK